MFFNRAIELASSLPPLQNPVITEETPNDDFKKDFYMYSLAKTHYDMKEYERAAYVSQNCKSCKGYFLHLYSLYMVRDF